jgi:hypothetical protein
MTQDWQPVKGWPQYEVSRLGDLRQARTQKPVGQWLSDRGYALARFSRPRRLVRVHRLVAEAFVPNPNDYPTVNHLNNNRSDNRAENLAWCTQAENLAHAEAQGRMCRDYWVGKRSPNAVLNDRQVFEIRQLYADGDTSWADLGRQFGVSKRTIGKIVRRETYV